MVQVFVRTSRYSRYNVIDFDLIWVYNIITYLCCWLHLGSLRTKSRVLSPLEGRVNSFLWDWHDTDVILEKGDLHLDPKTQLTEPLWWWSELTCSWHISNTIASFSSSSPPLRIDLWEQSRVSIRTCVSSDIRISSYTSFPRNEPQELSLLMNFDFLLYKTF